MDNETDKRDETTAEVNESESIGGEEIEAQSRAEGAGEGEEISESDKELMEIVARIIHDGDILLSMLGVWKLYEEMPVGIERERFIFEMRLRGFEIMLTGGKMGNIQQVLSALNSNFIKGMGAGIVKAQPGVMMGKGIVRR